MNSRISIPSLLLLLLLTLTTVSADVTTNNLAFQALSQARDVIADMVRHNFRLAPQFLRMAFHDCIDVCDGCIDLRNSDNNGLGIPINALAPVVDQFANSTINVTRPDIWALAAAVAADVTPHGTISQPINFTMNWFGRVSCEDANAICKNETGARVPCTAKLGPARPTASTNFDGPALFNFFATHFNFTQRQTVTIMGIHTIGRLNQNQSGINGPNGWDVNNRILQHEYYNALIGGATATTPLSGFAGASPSWVRVVDVNTKFPNKNRWALTAGGEALVMLNPDIALVRNLNRSNTDPSTGFVNCTFNPATAQPGIPVCPVSSTIRIAAQFSDSNDLWLKELKVVLDLMLTNGYNRRRCAQGACPLTLK